MKMSLILLFSVSVGSAFGQIPDPVPPPTGTWSTARAARLINRLKQPPPPPPGGFWVVEERPGDPAIVRFYTDQRLELRADTLRPAWPDLKSRVVVERLNERLGQLLDAQSTSSRVALHRP